MQEKLALAALSAGPGAARMRAWRLHAYGAARDLRLEAARVPALRAPGDVLVRVRAASLNPIDVAMLAGYGARALNALRALEGAADGVEFPLVPGRDFVGHVVRAGPDSRLRPGQRVWGVLPPHRQGCHADFVVVKDEWAGPAPAALSDAEAAGALYAALTACAALRAAGLGAGAAGGGAPGAAGRAPRVLLLGLGGVGQAALQLLAARGAHVLVGAAADLAPLAARLGAAGLLDRHAADYERRLQEAGPYDAVLDCAGLGGEEATARGWQFSRYVTLTSPLLRSMEARGVAAGAVCAAATLAAQNARAAAGARGAGPRAGPLPPQVRWAFFSPSATDIEQLRRLAERGQFGVCVEQVFPWWSGAEAYERAQRGAARGKLVLDFTAEAEGGGEPATAS
ncbi:LOW QUALITY PROTEIN: reticulon-4-interacting protein 1, mitochondrial-like [Spodoptera frugiperda]|uniref:LOW QUALITY PROTEIN: reticulon-4-interacting protein 1, mitochondrial-like n=1 Tax=Spodoptera frugiperda TaxID=7108 RepID=A0A9R0DL91_SPOFR|nr:LOW QUALITY PROTEIN: reticulon-4-interacting protein 1, mitochondrial-like [Spodoptera frugiperda]